MKDICICGEPLTRNHEGRIYPCEICISNEVKYALEPVNNMMALIQAARNVQDNIVNVRLENLIQQMEAGNAKKTTY